MNLTALLIVDVQNDFLPGGALAVPRGDEVIPVTNRLQDVFDLVLATQDWHPRNHHSFAANHAGCAAGECIQLGGQPQVLWPVHCVEGTPGAALSPALAQSRLAHVFRKGTDPEIDSYSGFFDNGHQRSTGLDEYLRHRKVTTVYLCGLATDYCVKATAIDASKLGLETWLVTDACRGVELKAGDIEGAVREMTFAGVKLTTSDQVIEKLSASAETSAT